MKIIKGGSSKSSVCTDEELKAVNAFAKAFEMSVDAVVYDNLEKELKSVE